MSLLGATQPCRWSRDSKARAAKHPTHELSAAGGRQRFDEVNDLRHFVGRQMQPAVGDQLIGRRLGPSRDHDVRMRHLALDLIRLTAHCDQCHRLVADQCAFVS